MKLKPGSLVKPAFRCGIVWYDVERRHDNDSVYFMKDIVNQELTGLALIIRVEGSAVLLWSSTLRRMFWTWESYLTRCDYEES